MARVAVLGAGISGLATSYYLQRLHPTTTILQFDSKPNGLISTKSVNGFTFEQGPRSINISQKL